MGSRAAIDKNIGPKHTGILPGRTLSLSVFGGFTENKLQSLISHQDVQSYKSRCEIDTP
jgi:hypothetical protein